MNMLRHIPNHYACQVAGTRTLLYMFAVICVLLIDNVYLLKMTSFGWQQNAHSSGTKLGS